MNARIEVHVKKKKGRLETNDSLWMFDSEESRTESVDSRINRLKVQLKNQIK